MSVLRSLCLALVMSTALLSGCASFEKKELERVHAHSLQNAVQTTQKPSVYVDLRFHRGEPGSKAKEQPGGLSIVRPAVEKAINNAGVFSSYTFDTAEQETADYTLRIDAYNHGNMIAASIMGFVCGYSFGVIPAAATDNYTLQFKAMDNSGKVLKDYVNKDAVTTWMGLWFIPVMGKTPKKAIDSTLENQVLLALQVLVEGGVIKKPSQISSAAGDHGLSGVPAGRPALSPWQRYAHL